MSGKPVEFHPEALVETEAAVAWHRERSFRAAEVFVSDLEKAITAIPEAPHWWPLFEAGCRRFPLRRFPYLVIHRAKPESIEALPVAHGRRRPGHWCPRNST